MGSPYPFLRTLRWPLDFLRPYEGTRAEQTRTPYQGELTKGEEPADVMLCFIGDLMVSQGDKPPEFCEGMKGLMSRADLVIATCEAPVSRKVIRPDARYLSNFVMPREYLLETLQKAGIGPHQLVLSLANNHINDNGYGGIVETVDILSELGIRSVGVSNAVTDRKTIIRAGSLKLTFAAWTQWMNDKSVVYNNLVVNRSEDLPTMLDFPAEHDRSLRVALPHWGHEFRHVPEPRERALARVLLGENAFDIVVGSHPHALQSLDVIGGRLCAYSLGNFVFAQAPYLRFGGAWSLGLVPILVVNVVSSGVKRPYVRDYRLNIFYQTASAGFSTVVELDELDGRLRSKAVALLSRMFT